MEYSFYSRKFDQKITFYKCRYYVYINLNGKPGSLGKQICVGGKLLGSTVGHNGDNYDDFVSGCKKWWNAFLRDIREAY